MTASPPSAAARAAVPAPRSPEPAAGPDPAGTIRLWEPGTAGRGLVSARAEHGGPFSGRVLAEPADLSDQEWVDWAVSVCRDLRVGALRPSGRVGAVSVAADRFAAAGTRLLCPSPAALARAGVKSSVYRHADRVGLAVPNWRAAACATSARSVTATLLRAHPDGLVAKPDGGTGGAGVTVLPDVDATEAWAARLPDKPGLPWVVMPYLPGPEVVVTVLSGPSRVHAVAAVETTPEGSRPVGEPVAEAASADLVRRLGLGPLTCVKWRADTTGRLWLVDADACPSGPLGTASRAVGVDLVWAAAREAVLGDAGLGDSGPPVRPDL